MNVKGGGTAPVVGVLAIQGGFQAHIDMLHRLGVQPIEVRASGELENITHLIIPGGESSTIRKVTQTNGYWGGLAGFKGPVMGTCMGSILMASEIEKSDEDGWGMLDISIRRNAYGPQVHSSVVDGKAEFSAEPFEMVFIRAPKIIRMGERVRPIAWMGDDVVGVVSGNKMALTFHPELSDDPGFHKLFLELR